MDDVIDRLKEIEGVNFTKDDGVIVVALELPVRVEKVEDKFSVSYSNNLLIPGLHKIRRTMLPGTGCQVKFVGYCGYSSPDEGERELLRELLEPFDCYPVFPEHEEDLQVLLTFVHAQLSPVFHSVVGEARAFDSKAWSVYQRINRLWSDCVCKLVDDSENDLIWLHDVCPLLLVPSFISRRLRYSTIGLFLHTPFPCVDLFRCLPVRSEILRSMLCCELIGFHFFDYARNFLAACRRLLGIEHRFNLGGFITVEYNGRSIHVKINHVSILINATELETSSPLENTAPSSPVLGADDLEVQRLSQIFAQRYRHRFVFLSIDRCDYLSGLILKLQSFRHYLRSFPYAPRNVVLVQYAYPVAHTSLSTTDGEPEFQRQLRALADEINREFQLDVVELHLRPVKQKEKWAALKAADCLFDTSIRDGLNLIAFEFILCHSQKSAHIILSEFTGCSSTLTSCQRVHPYSREDIARKLDLCYSTPPCLIDEKWQRDVTYLQANSLRKWASDFLLDLKRAHSQTDTKIYMRCGFASTYRVLSLDEHFKVLDPQEVTVAYRGVTGHNSKRLLFFDYEGTLAPDRRHMQALRTRYTCWDGGDEENTEQAGLKPLCGDELSAVGARPSAKVLRALTQLCGDCHNVCYVFSGRPKEALQEWFGAVKGLGLCAEHGYYIRPPNSEWQNMSNDEVDLAWKEVVLRLMQPYVRRTQGSFIENKGSALVFQYRNCDPDFGAWQAKDLSSYLEEMLFGMPVTVMAGKGYVETRLSGISKGVACHWVMDRVTDTIHFALALGDDRSDEEMFQALTKATQKLRSTEDGSPSTRNASKFNRDASIFCVTVGKKPSYARWFVNDTDEVSDLLESLVAVKPMISFDDQDFPPPAVCVD